MESEKFSRENVKGHVGSSGFLYGSVGLAFALVLETLGFFEQVNHWLVLIVENHITMGVHMSRLSLLPSVIAVAAVCIGVALVILDSSSHWRRVLIAVSSLVLIVVMVPALAVWNIYFSPFLALVGVFWASLCAIIYASQHRMPCDVANYPRVDN